MHAADEDSKGHGGMERAGCLTSAGARGVEGDVETTPSSLAVVVFAGGEGRRMGGRKPERAFGGATLIARAVAQARAWSPTVAVAVRHAGQAPAGLGAPLILDDPGVGGPAAGLVAAFAFARAQGAGRLLTLPCDTPVLPEDLALRLEAALAGEAAVAVASSLGRLHPTCALWRTAAADALPGYLATRASLRGFAETCGMAVADWPCAPDADPFANANTPEELAALEARFPPRA
jgi:molybdopterin-guanine dinucleotide biosynthesis protein A